VLDRKTLAKLAIAVASSLSTLISIVLALMQPPTSGGVACGLDAAQQLKVEPYARDLMKNSTCALNVTWH